MTTKVDTLVDRYLTDLAAELRDLPANRRRELLDEVSQHIAEARATLDADNEAAIRTVLERLGDPADIAAEARERVAIPAAPAKPAPRLEVIVLVTLDRDEPARGRPVRGPVPAADRRGVLPGIQAANPRTHPASRGLTNAVGRRSAA